MATDAEIAEFVEQNREVIERMMAIRRDTMKAAMEVGGKAADEALSSAVAVIDRTEEFVKGTYAAITDPLVQKHFMNMGVEFIAGLKQMAESMPVPERIRENAEEFRRSVRAAACRSNTECPAKKCSEKEITEGAE